jgi:CRP-like cAMP-binding protein
MDNSEIAKYFYFVKKGGCIVEFTNENMVYKEPMLAGQVFGFESLLTNIYHSKATANTMAEIVQVKKTLMMKIFETFPQFE